MDTNRNSAHQSQNEDNFPTFSLGAHGKSKLPTCSITRQCTLKHEPIVNLSPFRLSFAKSRKTSHNSCQNKRKNQPILIDFRKTRQNKLQQLVRKKETVVKNSLHRLLVTSFVSTKTCAKHNKSPGPGRSERNPDVSFITLNFKYFVQNSLVSFSLLVLTVISTLTRPVRGDYLISPNHMQVQIDLQSDYKQHLFVGFQNRVEGFFFNDFRELSLFLP